MATVQTLAWGSVTKAILDEALTTAGLTGLHAESNAVPGTFVTGWNFHTGEGTTDNLVAWFGLGGGSDRCYTGASGGAAEIGANYGWASTNVRIVATGSAFAIMNIDANGASKIGTIITKDNAGSLCCITCGADAQSLNSPAVVPWDAQYTAKIQYAATASNAFGCTSLAYIPVPSFDGTAKYLPTVCFAHAVQHTTDGKLSLNNVPYYNLGGAWFLRDSAA